jgi:prevent-host-death family protein
MERKFCNTVETKAKLNELLNNIERGQEIIIQRRGKSVAKLVPLSAAGPDDEEQTKIFLSHLRKFHRRIRRRHGFKGQTLEILKELRKES